MMFCFFKDPKYVIMKGLGIDDRALLFMGVDPVYAKNEYGNIVVSFSNIADYEYYASNIYINIRTFRALIKWRRLLGKDKRKVLVKKRGRWQRIL